MCGPMRAGRSPTHTKLGLESFNPIKNVYLNLILVLTRRSTAVMCVYALYEGSVVSNILRWVIC